MEATFKELAKDPSSVELSNVETVFHDDSLCVIHADVSAKNGLGTVTTEKYEYILIGCNDKNYEAFQEISDDDDGVYVSHENYDQNKEGTMYENLPYEAGIRYFAAKYTNIHGREAGNKDGESFTIPVPTGTGAWDVRAYKDEFGEEGSDKYLLLTGTGVFSNSATTNSKMTAFFCIDKDDDFSFKLVEYDSNVVKSDDSYDYHIKDSTGEVYDIVLYNSDSSGQMSSWLSDNREAMKKILSRGGIITVSVRERDAYSTPDTYLFKLDVTGFKKAMSFL